MIYLLDTNVWITVLRHPTSSLAVIALANGCTLVTHNTAEFSRVPNLVLEDWQIP